MNRRQENGIALITTLIMLSLVTFTAVAFLAMTRRERATVQVTEYLTTTREVVQAAESRASAEMVSRMISSQNRFGYDLLVSQNFLTTGGFVPANGTNIDNVGYGYTTGDPLSMADQIVNIGNLYYDPRVPVYVDNDGDGKVAYDFSTIPPQLIGPDDFRFYLDFNRNGRFEPTFTGTGIFDDGTSHGSDTNWFGDPHWIGILEKPDARHAPNNRFVGRYAYVVMPAGKSLDLNYLHNHSKYIVNTDDGFLRNQGVGSWEINLAGFLVELNRYAWQVNQFNGTEQPGNLGTLPLPYLYRPANTTFRNEGDAFVHALGLLEHTYDTGNGTPVYTDLNNLFEEFGAVDDNYYRYDGIDTFADGPINMQATLRPSGVDDDSVVNPWPGASKPSIYLNIGDLFDATGSHSGFTDRMTERMKFHDGHYDRYTFYRLLSQLGTDSAPPLRSKIHLNFDNELQYADNLYAKSFTPFINSRLRTQNNFSQTNFIRWTPQRWFDTVAETLMEKRYSYTLLTDNTDPRYNPIPVFNGNDPTVGYTSDIHQTLQLAANIFDATTYNYNFDYTNALAAPMEWDMAQPYAASTTVLYNGLVYRCLSGVPGLSPTPPSDPGNWVIVPHVPTVWVPNFIYDAANDIVRIESYRHEETTDFLATNVWLDLNFLNERQMIPANPHANIYGIPAIIGAKKGLPNFNEFAMQTSVQVTRKVEIVKGIPVGATNFVQTNQMILVNVFNKFSAEFWNSYTQAYPNPVSVVVRHHQFGGVTNSAGTLLASWANDNPRVTPVPNWPRGAFVSGMWTNNNVTPYAYSYSLTNAQYTLFPSPGFKLLTTFDRPSGFPNPDWYLGITNRLAAWIIDNTTGKLVDMVSLNNLSTSMDIQQQLLADDSAHWNPERVGGSTSVGVVTEGVLRQIRASINPSAAGTEGVTLADWDNYIPLPSRNDQVDQFRRFMNLAPLYNQNTPTSTPPETNHSLPFQPTFTYHQIVSWQANDPLVHYTLGDLVDPVSLANGNYSFHRVRPSWEPLPGEHTYAAYRRVRDPSVGVSGIPARNERYLPWGGNHTPGVIGETNAFPRVSDYYLALKDAGVRWSDDWNFPTFPLANVGWLGRVHRGTPWQTIYMKADMPSNQDWRDWANNNLTHPRTDRQLFDMFTALPNDNAGRGLLNINQTNSAAWFAALSGINVISNNIDDYFLDATVTPTFAPITIEPTAPELVSLFEAIQTARQNRAGGVFTDIGQILTIPELTVGRTNLNAVPVHSPFINASLGTVSGDPNDPFTNLEKFGLTDMAYEYLPQQLLSLLTVGDDPRYTVYAFGQSLKPAKRSIILAAGPTRGLCTNYQITGEIETRSTYRVEGVNPQLTFTSTANNVDVTNERILIGKVAFNLDFPKRHRGDINGTPIRFFQDPNLAPMNTLPDPLVEGRTYFVVNAGIDSFQVSTLTNGAALNLDLTGITAGTNRVVTVPRVVLETYHVLDDE